MRASETELFPRVVKVISKSSRVPAENITIDTSFEQLGLDSVDAVNITFDLEEEFGIEIPGDGLLGLSNIRDIVSRLDSVLAEST
jgi:acyl carrier protein